MNLLPITLNLQLYARIIVVLENVLLLTFVGIVEVLIMLVLIAKVSFDIILVFINTVFLN